MTKLESADGYARGVRSTHFFGITYQSIWTTGISSPFDSFEKAMIEIFGEPNVGWETFKNDRGTTYIRKKA